MKQAWNKPSYFGATFYNCGEGGIFHLWQNKVEMCASLDFSTRV